MSAPGSMFYALGTVAAAALVHPHEKPLQLWVVYDKPRDYPEDHVARRWEIRAGSTCATDETIVGPLGAIRRRLADKGLHALKRDPTDDPVIVECWL
jgi:hypothetical protein